MEKCHKICQRLPRVDPSNLNLFKFKDFSGIPTRLRFVVNRPIEISSLSFYGPRDYDEHDYRIIIKICTERWGQEGEVDTLLQEELIPKQVFKKYETNIVYVRPTVIPGNTVIVIKFKLQGPETLMWKSVEERCPERVNVEGVDFHFRWSRTKQLPFIGFSII